VGDSIRLSRAHGLQPVLTVCFLCGEDKGEIALLGAQGDKIARSLGCSDGKMPMRCCLDKNPCAKCQEYMKQGVIFVEVRDGEGGENPYRTGGFWVIKSEAVEKMMDPGKAAEVLKSRICFVEKSVAEKIGLRDFPDTDKDEEGEGRGQTTV